MKVKITKMGYMFYRRVKEDEVIVLEDEKLFSKNWMEKLEKDSKEKTKVKVEKVVKPVPLSQAAKVNESFEDAPKPEEKQVDKKETPTGSKEVI